jgi:hypothetical protein
MIKATATSFCGPLVKLTLLASCCLACLLPTRVAAHTTQSIDAELATIDAELSTLQRKAALLKDLRNLINVDSKCEDIEGIVEKSLKDLQLQGPQHVGGDRRPRRRGIEAELSLPRLAIDLSRGFSRHLTARANTTLSTSVICMRVLSLANSRKMKKQGRNDPAVPSTNLVLTVSAHGAIVIKNDAGETLASDAANLVLGELVVAAEAMALKDALVALVTSRGRLLIHNFVIMKGRRIMAGRNDPMLWKLNEPSDNLVVMFRQGVLYHDKQEQRSGDTQEQEEHDEHEEQEEPEEQEDQEEQEEQEQEHGLVKLTHPTDTITAVGLVPTRSALNIIVLGTSSGRVHVLGGNMTVAFSSPQFGDGKTPVTAFLTHISSNVQAAVGDTVFFYSWYRQSPLEFRCVGPLGSTIVSMAQDHNDRYTLHAGTDKGEILTFDTRGSYRHGSDHGACILRHKLIAAEVAPSAFAPVAVQATLGYMFAAAALSKAVFLLAFNTTGPQFMAPSMIMKHKYAMPPSVKVPTDRALPFALSALFNGRHAIRTTNNYLSVVLPLGPVDADSPPCDGDSEDTSCTEGEENSLLGYETILPVEKPDEGMDITWIRGPLLGMSVVGVVLWQVYRRRNGNPGGSRGGNGFVGGMGGMRGGGGGPIPADIRAQIDRLSRTGPPGGFR